MNIDLQRASLLKRFSAYLLDMMILVCLVVTLAAGLSAVLGTMDHIDRMNDIYDSYGLNITQEEYEKYTDAQKEAYQKAVEALEQDEEAMSCYSVAINLMLITVTVSILLGYVILELVIPLILGNGQTVGKKVFGIAVMRTDGVKVTPFMMVVRTILGKYTVETMIPVLIIMMLMFGTVGILGTIMLGLILLLQVILIFATRTHSTIHDLAACTVAVDMASQRIFDSPEARLAYLQKVSAENAANAKY